MADNKDRQSKQWQLLLSSPDISPQISPENVYRAACIGAVALLYEAGNARALADMVLHAASPENRDRALAALESLTRVRKQYAGCMNWRSLMHSRMQRIF